jgi:hypothetical protein
VRNGIPRRDEALKRLKGRPHEGKVRVSSLLWRCNQPAVDNSKKKAMIRKYTLVGSQTRSQFAKHDALACLRPMIMPLHTSPAGFKPTFIALGRGCVLPGTMLNATEVIHRSSADSTMPIGGELPEHGKNKERGGPHLAAALRHTYCQTISLAG